MNHLLRLSALLALIMTLAGSPCHASPVPITHGVASGEISPTSVLIWARAAPRVRWAMPRSPVG